VLPQQIGAVAAAAGNADAPDTDNDGATLDGSDSTVTIVNTRLHEVAQQIDQAVRIRKVVARRAAVAEAFSGAARGICRFMRVRKQRREPSPSGTNASQATQRQATPPPDPGAPITIEEEARIMEGALEAHRLRCKGHVYLWVYVELHCHSISGVGRDRIWPGGLALARNESCLV